jgi:hypothetical protein
MGVEPQTDLNGPRTHSLPFANFDQKMTNIRLGVEITS